MKEPLRALIVDDEPLARARIRALLEAAGDVDVVGQCSSGDEAVAAILRFDPDLVFLDVQMPGRSGFDVVEAIGVERMPVTIFVTAYDQHALRAFEAHALDYLLKPFDQDRFEGTLDRARVQIRQRHTSDLEQRLETALSRVLARPKYVDRIVIRTGSRLAIVPAGDVDYISAESNYLRIHAGKENHLLRETMTNMEAALDPKEFVRIHRSTLVRIDRIVELQSLFQGEYTVVLRDRTKLTSSRTYRERLEQAVELKR